MRIFYKTKTKELTEKLKEIQNDLTELTENISVDENEVVSEAEQAIFDDVYYCYDCITDMIDRLNKE